MNLVMVDPGHGGTDFGASVEGVNEKDINLAISLELAQMLAGSWTEYVPVLTRYTDTAMPLSNRCVLERVYNPSCFVSIHCNAASSGMAKGFEVFTTKGVTRADALATKVLEEIKARFPGMVLRTDFQDGDPDKEENFQVLKGTRSPAVLVECGFVSNVEERALLATKQFQIRVAAALAYGIARWFLI